MKILHTVGARPNFMKLAPVYNALSRHKNVQQYIVHTGQHYDINMSEIFFQQLAIPAPNINLEVGSGSHAVQTAQIMIKLEPILLKELPNIIMVYGDVNSTVATTLVAAKLRIQIAHVEAGLRSFDRTMPEEINRLITDQLSDFLFIHSDDARLNLLREGISESKIHSVGNVMIDTLVKLLPKARQLKDDLLQKYGAEKFALVTLHRPSNVDESAKFREIIAALIHISNQIPIIFPVHPRTRVHIEALNLNYHENRLHLIAPLSYLEFLCLESYATVVITDSGGIQEETTYLGIPCLTIRENTERPVTVTLGTNTLIGKDMQFLTLEVRKILQKRFRKGDIPALWDGKTSDRIANIIVNKVGVI
jgi:UDP-N-acetylglucosamine 2-epimerase (non-hydrolysing)